MALSPLQLDYQRDHRRTPWIGIALLLLGFLVAGMGASRYKSLTEDVAQWEQRNSDVERRLERKAVKPKREPKDTQLVAQQITQANEVVRQLGLPWELLFREVEAARSDRVALLAIEPDAQKHVVRITGEARQLEDVLDYVTRLGKSRHLVDIYLQSHQAQTTMPDQPIRFALMAGWKKDK